MNSIHQVKLDLGHSPVVVIGEGAVVDHGRDVGVLVIVRSIVVAIGVCYDCKTCKERSLIADTTIFKIHTSNMPVY